ncbi:unnamed protein product [Tilletia controversa]|nr:unnamed protein product [Tilletia controversa]
MVTSSASTAATDGSANAAASSPASAQSQGRGNELQKDNIADDDDDEDEDDDDDDQDFGDWVDDDDEGGEGGPSSAVYADADAASKRGPKTPTHALFPDVPGQPLKLFSRPAAALQHAKENGCDFRALVRSKSLDALQVIRLLNYLRRAASKGASLSAEQINAISGSEPFLNDDAELAPVPGFEMDGLLQIDFDDDDDIAQDGTESNTQKASGEPSRPSTSELESELLALRLAFQDLRERYAASIGLSDADRAAVTEDSEKTVGSSGSSVKGKNKLSPFAGVSRTHAPLSANDKEDDQHYFTSYASNDIHQTMISDSVRTLSYAKFILSPQNSHLFRNKIIMDVGCGSGILSLFAARAGAATVLAIDASDIADRTVLNVQENGFGSVIRVFKGKIEELGPELAPYEGKVDVIVSEWMGYFLIYEAMLPSVLHARDLYLRKPSKINADNGTSTDGGILAPSHTRMTLAGVEDAELLHERIHFWADVYGFKMSAMAKGLADDAYTEGLKKEAVITDTANIFDLPLMTMSTRQPEFESTFSLKASRKGTMHAFLSWFDTWFLPAPLSSSGLFPPQGRRDTEGGEILPDLPPCQTAEPVRADVSGLDESLRGNAVVPAKEGQDVEQGPGEVVSFTTGPEGKETHWKATAFLLKDPIEVEQGSTITGRIKVTKSSTHSRELEAELHYLVQHPSDEQEAKVKRVQTTMVQHFAVRMFGTPRISSIFLLALGTALATVTAVNAETDPSLPERVLVGKASLKAELYSRADPLNLFGLQRPRHDPRDDVVGQVIDQTVGLARGMTMEERQIRCTNSGYGLCPDKSGCCPVGGQCCPGDICCSKITGSCSRVYDHYECCPPGVSCNGIDGCAVGRRACPKDPEGCCPFGSSCAYGSDGKVNGCSRFASGSGNGPAGDTSTFSVISSTQLFTSSSIFFFPTTTVSSSSSRTTDVLTFNAPPTTPTTTSTTTSTTTTPVSGGLPFPVNAAAPRVGNGASLALTAVAVAILAGVVAL